MSRLPRIILASASPARLSLLRNVGIEPEVLVSSVDEDALVAARGWSEPADIALGLAKAKAEAVAASVSEPALVIGCDSVMEFGGQPYGKPESAEVATERLRLMSGGSGRLFTGHHVIHVGGAAAGAVTGTLVEFHTLSDAEVKAYVATGEPLRVAGSYTIDSLGGPFIRSISGDPSNVVGLSLPTLRGLLAELGFGWELVLQQVTAK